MWWENAVVPGISATSKDKLTPSIQSTASVMLVLAAVGG